MREKQDGRLSYEWNREPKNRRRIGVARLAVTVREATRERAVNCAWRMATEQRLDLIGAWRTNHGDMRGCQSCSAFGNAKPCNTRHTTFLSQSRSGELLACCSSSSSFLFSSPPKIGWLCTGIFHGFRVNFPWYYSNLFQFFHSPLFFSKFSLAFWHSNLQTILFLSLSVS